MGGGLSKFLPATGSKYGKGNRLEQDLVEEWKKEKESRNVKATYVSNVTELQQVDESKTDYLLGKKDYVFINTVHTCNDLKNFCFFPRFIFRRAHGLPLADCLLYTSPSPRDRTRSRMPSSA